MSAILLTLTPISQTKSASIDEAYQMQDVNIQRREEIERETKEDYNVIKNNRGASLSNLENGRYELAIAKSDGNFERIEVSNDFPDLSAKFEANNNNDIVVRDLGRAMGNKVLRMKNGLVISTPEKLNRSTIVISSAHYTTYISKGYDCFFVSSNGEDVKIKTMGFQGRVTSNQNMSSISQLELIPENQVSGFSYYIKNKEGDLVHYIIKYNYDANSDRYFPSSLYGVTVDRAPVFMEKDKKYYSYDGESFYTDPYERNFVGKFYPYYKNLSFRSKTSYTANDLNEFISNNSKQNSALRNTGEAFIQAENKHGINATLLLAMAIHESGFGMSKIAIEKNNLFGVEAYDSSPYASAKKFNTIADAIGYQASVLIGRKYLGVTTDYRFLGAQVGDKETGLNVKYASDPYWGEKIAGWYYRMDKALGLKDFNKYTLALTYQPTNVYSQPKSSSSVLYTLSNKSKTFPKEITTLLRGESGDFYEIQADIPIINGNAVNTDDYNFAHSKGYIFKNSVMRINETLNYLNPALEKDQNSGITQQLDIKLERIFGNNRYLTSGAISSYYRKKASTVIIASGEDFPDALSSSALAHTMEAPILLCERGDLPKSTRDEIKRLNPNRILVLGSKNAISDEIFLNLAELVPDISRVEGKNRFETAANIGEMLREKVKTDICIVLSGLNFPDALSANVLSAREGYPILFTGKDDNFEQAVDKIKQWGIKKVIIVGGEKAVSKSVEDKINSLSNVKEIERISGLNRYQTATNLAEKYFSKSQNMILASGENFPDAVSAGPLATWLEGPILLSAKGSIENQTLNLIRDKADKLIIIGGQNAISKELEKFIVTITN